MACLHKIQLLMVQQKLNQMNTCTDLLQQGEAKNNFTKWIIIGDTRSRSMGKMSKQNGSFHRKVKIIPKTKKSTTEWIKREDCAHCSLTVKVLCIWVHSYWYSESRILPDCFKVSMKSSAKEWNELWWEHVWFLHHNSAPTCVVLSIHKFLVENKIPVVP